MLMSFSSFSQQNDSIAFLQVSTALHIDTVESTIQIGEMDYPFIDQDKHQIYYYIRMSDAFKENTSTFLFLEIKKRTNMQFKYKAEYSKRINTSEFQEGRLIDSISIAKTTLQSGNYELILSYMNDSNKVLHQVRTGFQLLRTIPFVANVTDNQDTIVASATGIVDLDKTFVSKYTVEQLKKNIKPLLAIADGAEIRFVREVDKYTDVYTLRRFFYNFWQNRNATNPEAAWRAYADKLNYIGKKYGASTTSGHETDRGRIYLMFGEPDIMERQANEKGALPYEVWFYYKVDGRSNVKILFYQSGLMASQMFLLHSTEEDIVVNPNWKQILLENSGDNDAKLMHRVFEYFK
jgi:GWxTD domain-containing protein